MPSIKEQFDDFRRNVMHPESPRTQVREMKWAFFAGARAMLTMCRDLARGTEEAFSFQVDMWENELQQFKRDVDRGRE